MTDSYTESKKPDYHSLPPADDQPVQIIAGRYEVVQTLSGGMALVHLCRDQQTGQLVALKTFKPKFLSHRAARDLFLREGTTWVDIGRHPHIVRAYRVERIGDGLEIFLVLEWVVQPKGIDKPSLRAWLRPGRPLPLKQALLFSLHIVRGMKFAVSKIPGLVHRDLKPENVLIGYDGQARVTDFGLASTLSILGDDFFNDVNAKKDSNMRTQITQGAAGTPLYMPPEQWLQQPLDARSDIYALGCMMYEMITGRFAAIAETREAIKEIHLSGRIKPPPESVPREVVAFLRKCIMPMRTQRFRDWNEVENELKALFPLLLAMDPPAERSTETETREEKLAAGHSYNNMGLSYLDLGKMPVAIMYFEQAVWAGRTENSLELEGAGLGNLGRAYRALGYLDRAIEFHQEHLAIAQQIGDRAQEGRAFGDLGRAYGQLGDRARAVRYHQEELKIARELGDPFKEAAALDSLGDTFWQLEDVSQAVEFYKQSLALAREIEDRARVKSILSSMGHVYLHSGEVKEAVALFHQALSLARKIGDRIGEGEALGDLGYLYGTLGHEEKAVEYYTKALQIAREGQDRRREAAHLVRLADVQVTGDLQQVGMAKKGYEQALTAVEGLGDRLQMLNILSKLGRTYHLLGDYMGAASLHKRALNLAVQMRNHQAEHKSLLALARAYESWGDSSRAIEYYRNLLTVVRQSGDWETEREILPGMIGLYTKLKQIRPALVVGEEYLTRALKNQDAQASIDAYNRLGEMYRRTNEARRAAESFRKAVTLSRSQKDAAAEAISLANLALAYQQTEGVGRGWQAVRNMEKALSRAQESGNEALIAEMTYKIAFLLFRQKKSSRAIAYAAQAAELAQNLQDKQLTRRAQKLQEAIIEQSRRTTGSLF